MTRTPCPHHGAERPCTCALGKLYRFVEPIILFLLLKKQTAYGYELVGELNEHALTDAKIERGAVYRTLRTLEENGNVESSWDVSGSGPARRRYQLTENGVFHLQEWTEVMGKMAKGMRHFVEDVGEFQKKKGN